MFNVIRMYFIFVLERNLYIEIFLHITGHLTVNYASILFLPFHLFLYNFISKDLWRHANKNANELLHMSSCFMAVPAPCHASFKDTKK